MENKLSMEDRTKVLKSIIKARVQLLFDQPFFGTLLTRLQLVDATESTFCNTAAVDGRKLYYNNYYFLKLTENQIKFVLCHEILHCIYDHIGRCGNRDPDLFNMANDYIVNYTLVDNKIGDMPSNVLYDTKYTDEYTSEELYDLLKKNQVTIKLPLDFHFNEIGDKGKGKNKDDDDGSSSSKSSSSKNGGKSSETDDGDNSDDSGDDDGEDSDDSGDDGDNSSGSGSGGDIEVTIMGKNGPPVLTEEDIENLRAEMTAAAISAAQSASMAGKLPKGIERLIKQLTEPKMDWKSLLDNHIKSQIKENYSYTKPSRRSHHSGIILPGRMNAERIEVTCAIDNSGSMSDEMIRALLSEVKGIVTEFSDFVVDVLCFDTQVYNHVTFTPENADEIDTYQPMGGGGTDFDCVWNHLKDIELEPKKLIVFTDGYPWNSWGDENYCDTMFLIHGTKQITAPFGLTVYYEDDD